jgi:hypothetical protein
VGSLDVVWSLWLCRNDKVFNNSNYSLLIFSFCGHLFSEWRITTHLHKSIHDWRPRLGILYPYMGSRIIYEMDHHPPLGDLILVKRYNILPFLACDFWMAVFILDIQRSGVLLH